ncbi:hypothetical protein FQR65_LT04606 [Abscondita terminalis]|nr:hypothetical protein FQR65_LT04606 [Abscondita terminalis]
MDEKYNLKRDPNPKETASLFSKLTFLYAFPIFFKARKKAFTEDDIYETLVRDRSDVLGNKAEKLWNAEVEQCKEKRTVPSVKKVLLKMQKFNLFKMPSQVIFLGYIVSHYLDETSRTNAIPYTSVGIFLLSSIDSVLVLQLLLLEGFHTGMDIRIAACCLIYRKALKLNQSVFGKTTVGQMINLLSNDVGVFDRAIAIFQLVYIGPIQLILFTALLYLEMGISAFIGIAILIVFIPLQHFLGKLSSKYRLQVATRTDSRVRLMDEIIRGIEIIKMYAWEKSFAKLVAHHRRMEIKSLTKSSYIKGSFLIYFLYISVPLFLTILSYILLGNSVDAKKIFYSTAIFNILAFNMGTFFSQAVAALNEINVSSFRIRNFLLLDEVDAKKMFYTTAVFNILAFNMGTLFSQGVASINEVSASSVRIKKFLLHDEVHNVKRVSEGSPILLRNVTAKWSKSIENTLTNLNVCIEEGCLVAIVGSVGSGKSSLLQSILGEITVTSGDVLVNGSVSYSSQDPWIFNSSIRQNILFGNEMDEIRYTEVVKACALAKDLKMFTGGDKVTAGEQGSALSGGQKARVNLARAVYRRADIYLLDDPLSAVDVNVSKEIFDNCICGLLKKKTVVLVTHQLQYLQKVDRIIVLENGRVRSDGTFEQLQKLEINFAKLLKRETVNDECKKDHKKYASTVELSKKSVVKVEEQRSTGTVSTSAYVDYIAACGSKILAFFVIALFILVQVLLSGTFYFVTYWVNYEQSLRQNTSQIYYESIETRTSFIFIYSGLTVAIFLLIVLRNTISFKFCMRCSTHIHNCMFESIVHATMQFFIDNSPGRILNRFTKDTGVMDELLPLAMAITTQTIVSIIGILFITCLVNFWLIIPSVVILLASIYIRKFYLSSSINIKRLEGITKSPVFGHLHATLQGLTTVRAFEAQEILNMEFCNKQDLHSCANFLFLSISRALSYFLDLISFCYVAVITLILVVVSGEYYGGNIGLAITQALQLLIQFQWGIRHLTEMENYMTSVERILDYNFIDHERDFTNANQLDCSWPASGKIVFEKVYFSYSPDTLVLKNLNFVIQPEEKVGIVGRTGAGKSSMISAIFQLFEIEGNILIDDVNIKEIGLHDLRKKISIIPQNPMLFGGSIRKNLDPFDEYADEALWKALEDVKMKEAVEALDSGLQMEISEGGSNLSVGQRQLICLARAIIRNNKILVLDEATANIDLQTDVVIQETIRKKFSKCTVLTIAHRLETILDSDRILVLDAGEIVEFDSPNILMQSANGSFYKMIQKVDRNMTNTLIGSKS